MRGSTPGPGEIACPQKRLSPRAGKNHQPHKSLSGTFAYPRVRGRTSSRMSRTCASRRLSPRAGKNQQRDRLEAAGRALIPACGEATSMSKRTAKRSGVYPRVRGRTTIAALRALNLGRLSPRAGKNRRAKRSQSATAALIPACGEEPRAAKTACW